MLKLYHAAMSPCTQKVRLVLHEKSLAYDSVLLNLMRKENLEPSYLAVNPHGVVPTLIDDGQRITESSVICEYLDDRYPERSLRPRDAVSLAHMRLWAKRVDDKIHPASAVLSFGVVLRNSFLHLSAAERAAMLAKVPDPVRRERQEDLLANGIDSPRFSAAVEIFRHMADDIEATVSRTPWMLGESLSLADFALTPYARIMEVLLFARALAARPALRDWLVRLKQTRGYQGGLAAFEAPAEVERRAALAKPLAAKLDEMFETAPNDTPKAAPQRDAAQA